ncbi:hypothetical protein CDAR_479111, partial [Caerostris darwini]
MVKGIKAFLKFISDELSEDYLYIYLKRYIIMEFARAVFGKSPEGYSGKNTAG